MPMSRSTAGKLGMATRLAVEDPRKMTEAARAGQMRRYLEQVDAHAAETGEVLSPEERMRRALQRRRCDMIRRAESARTAKKRNAAVRKAGLRRRLDALEAASPTRP